MPDETKKLSGEFVLGNTKKIADKETAEEKELEDIPAASGVTKNKATFLSSLCMYPTNVKFENQEVDEFVVLLIRRDLITNVPWILTALFFSLVPFIFFLFPGIFTPFFDISPLTQIVSLLFYYLVIFGFILIEFTLWYFNVGLITNKRIVDLDLSGILFKHVSETRLNLIEDVSYSKVGSIRAIFDYGDVILQTAGTIVNFEFNRAPEPARIVRIIADMIGGKDKWKL